MQLYWTRDKVRACSDVAQTSESDVSQVSHLGCANLFQVPADWKSAIQQIANLRYDYVIGPTRQSCPDTDKNLEPTFIAQLIRAGINDKSSSRWSV
jgi:hypothetical protein